MWLMITHEAAPQMSVDTVCDAATVGDRPYDERLSARRIAGRKNEIDVGVAARVRCDVAACVERELEIGDEPFAFGTDESHREQYQVARDFEWIADRFEFTCFHDNAR